MRRRSPPNLRVWFPFTLVMLSDHWNEFPTCGNSPSKLLPSVKPPETETSGTPSRVGPSPGVIPILLAKGVPNKGLLSELLIVPASDRPVKQKGLAASDAHESVTLLVLTE